jgi:hypothetical protein
VQATEAALASGERSVSAAALNKARDLMRHAQLSLQGKQAKAEREAVLVRLADAAVAVRVEAGLHNSQVQDLLEAARALAVEPASPAGPRAISGLIALDGSALRHRNTVVGLVASADGIIADAVTGDTVSALAATGLVRELVPPVRPKYLPIAGRTDQREPALRSDRIVGRQWIGRQLRQLSGHLPLEAGPGLEQQPHRDQLRRAARQQPQQSHRPRSGVPQLVKRQRPGRGDPLVVLDRVTTGQQVTAPLAEQAQVGGNSPAGGEHVGRGLLQGQRQAAQFVRQLSGRGCLRRPGPFQQRAGRGLPVQHGHVAAARARPVLPPLAHAGPRCGRRRLRIAARA